MADKKKAEVTTTGGLEFSYDAVRDILTVEGVQYDGNLFRALGTKGLAVGETLKIVNRSADGVISLQHVSG